MGISLFLFATVNTEASNIGLNAMARKISECSFLCDTETRLGKHVLGAPYTWVIIGSIALR